MQHDLIWQALYTPALEHQRVTSTLEGGWQAVGHVVGVLEDTPFSYAYQVMLDSGWRVREVVVNNLLAGHEAIHLLGSGTGQWQGADRQPLPQFDGCIDIDFTATPFTNTLPIRRLQWSVGTSHDISVVYIVHPALTLSVSHQTYTCLAKDNTGARYHFKAGDFEQDITVDAEGFVIDYPELFERKWAKTIR
jgi:uncharacterized protein